MITGKDLIMFILKYDLVDKEIIKEEIATQFLCTAEELAADLGVGLATINVLYETGMIAGIELGDKIYFSRGTKLPKGDASVDEK